MINRKNGLIALTLVLIVTLIGAASFYGYRVYRCDQLENKLRNIIHQDVQQASLETNMRTLKMDVDEPFFKTMREHRRSELETVLQEMINTCGSDAVDTALRRSASEDFGL